MSRYARLPLAAQFTQLASSILIVVLAWSCVNAHAAELPRVARLDTTHITVSGLSSGAAMAVQLGVAYSARVSGVGVIAGPPYLCAQGSLIKAANECLLLGMAEWDKWFDLGTPAPPCRQPRGRDLDVADMIRDTSTLAVDGAIDATRNMNEQNVWQVRGTCDPVVGANASAALRAYYHHFGANYRARTLPQASHTLPTNKPDLGACNIENKNFVSSCKFDAVGTMLHHLLPEAPAARAMATGTWQSFDQGRYVEGNGDAAARVKALSMAQQAKVFVPEICTHRACKVHVALHGCKQGIDDAVYENFISNSGYTEWANAIGLVVLFPRAVAVQPFERSSLDAVGNPRGCWDWWGYTNSGADFRQYATKNAPQMQAIMKMVDALGGH